MRQVPYISITGITSFEQSTMMRRILDEVRYPHLFGAGVMMSYSTLHGHKTKWQDVYPPRERLADIFVGHPGVMNTLHYADYDDQTELEDLLQALRWAGDGVDAIQFDMPWPSARLLHDLRASRAADGLAPLKFIVQVGARALERMNHDPKLVRDGLEGYVHCRCMDYVLFDMSCGTGTLMSAERLLPYIWEFIVRAQGVGVVVAGGLGPDTLGPAERVACELFEDGIELSIDAQSKVAIDGNALNLIDPERATAYVRNAGSMLRGYMPRLAESRYA